MTIRIHREGDRMFKGLCRLAVQSPILVSPVLMGLCGGDANGAIIMERLIELGETQSSDDGLVYLTLAELSQEVGLNAGTAYWWVKELEKFLDIGSAGSEDGEVCIAYRPNLDRLIEAIELHYADELRADAERDESYRRSLEPQGPRLISDRKHGRSILGKVVTDLTLCPPFRVRGVYLLLKAGVVVYVGMSEGCIAKRLRTHARHSDKEFDAYIAIEAPAFWYGEVARVEEELIEYFKPIYNKTFSGSPDLIRFDELSEELSDRWQIKFNSNPMEAI